MQREDDRTVQKQNAWLYAMHLNRLMDDGRAALGLGRVDDALWAWTSVRTRFPDYKEAFTLPLAALLKEKRFQEAETLASEARQRFPQDLPIAEQHAQIARMRGEIAEATRRWEAIRRQFPDAQSGFVHGAATFAEAKLFEDAEELARQAMASFPDKAGPWIVHAQLAQRLEDWPEALERWEIVRERFPDRVEGAVGTAHCLRALGRLDELEVVTTEAKARFPYEPAVAVQYASAAHERGDLEEARLRWGWVRDRFPTRKDGYVGEARILAAQGKAQEADALFQAASRL
jgi:tetratricopeptide (TPR) repeat protein